jgi:hypothetical protein
MKIDCEGGEYGIFDSMTADLAARIDQISMEIHRLPNRTPEEIVQRLHQLGFQVRHTSPLYAHRIK